ncbi:MAG: hypothetical protein K2H40_16540 [Lachnospiraceae bacterium]|nr:hypothetical protein [Lachnospiraceae bacterium]
MKIIEKDIRKEFRITDRTIIIDEKRKEETLLFLQEEIAEKQIRMRSNRKKILFQQFRYMDKTMIGIHVAFCIIPVFIMTILHWSAGYGRFMAKIGEEEIILISTILSGILGIISIMGIGRVFFSGIAELGESCYFNVRQMVTFQMFLSSIINLLFLFIGILFVGIRWKMELLRIGLYILVPFVIAECCCLMVVLSEAGRKNSYILVMVGVFVIVFYCILASSPELYRITALTVWGAALIVGLLLLAVQMKILFRGIEKGEILCAN